MPEPSIYQQILDPANRDDPYPLYARLREIPVRREADGTYVVSTYREIVALLHDPRVSSEAANRPDSGTAPSDDGSVLPQAFITRDPPEHDRLRALATHPFGPPRTPGRIDALRPWLSEFTDRLIDGFAARQRVDIVDDFAYPLPVAAICELLGVPRGDEPRFREWAATFIETLDPTTGTFAEREYRRDRANVELGGYLGGLADARTRDPGDDLISGLVTDTGPPAPMSRGDLESTAALLLVAGHETTVNLITNGALTLLRNPDVLDRLREEPGLAIPLVEELLRYEPPVHMLTRRTATADIEVAGTTIPRGSPITLVLASGNRDPDRFDHPDDFLADRTDNQHLGFGNGIHYCFGAPLARVEAQIALTALARRLVNPRLLVDPPPYRPNPVLRGPRHLLVEVDSVVPVRLLSAV